MTDYSPHPNWRDELNHRRQDWRDSFIEGFCIAVLLSAVAVLAFIVVTN